MAITEYKCKKCGNIFVPCSGTREIKCPKCGSKDLEEKVLSINAEASSDSTRYMGRSMG